jgi:hypothetical protein
MAAIIRPLANVKPNACAALARQRRFAAPPQPGRVAGNRVAATAAVRY